MVSGKGGGGRIRGVQESKSTHSGRQFQSKKAAGDVKGTGKVEQYAYWPLDRKLTNRRRAKAKEGKERLDKVVHAVAGGVAKGLKARRMQMQAKKKFGGK